MPCNMSGSGGKKRAHSSGSLWGHLVAVQTPTGDGEMRSCMIQLKGRPTLSADIFAFG